MSEPVLAARGLKRSFTQGGTTIQVLRGIDLSIAPGEIVALLGPSGSGKSTLLQAVGLLEGGFEGSIKIRGEEAAHLDDDGRTRLRRETLGFVYQFHHLLADFDATENVMLPQVIFGTEPAAARERAEQLLATLGLGQRLDHRPAKLSGGEQQRVAVARALANRPPLVLADEPTGNLDETTADRVLAEFLQLVRGEGSAALIATHNERLAQKMDRLVRLHEGNPRMRIVVAVACALLLTGCGGSDNQDKLPDDLRSAEGAEEAAPAVANSLAPEPEDTPPPVAPAIGGSDNVEDEPVDDLAPLPALPRALPKPSFDCSGALSRVETLICNDPELALLDRRLARNYGRAIDESAPDQRSRLTNLGRRYLADRNRCPTRACVVQSYRWYLRDIDVVMGWPTP